MKYPTPQKHGSGYWLCHSGKHLWRSHDLADVCCTDEQMAQKHADAELTALVFFIVVLVAVLGVLLWRTS